MSIEELQKMKDEVGTKKAAVDFTQIENNLACYSDFILNIRYAFVM